MSATRTTSRALFATGRGREQCLRKSFAPLQAARSRALLSTTTRTHLHTASLRNRKMLGPGKQGVFFAPSRRMFSATTAALHGHIDTPKPGEELYVTFVDKEGDEHKLAVNKGDNLLTIAQSFDIEMEGACEGSCSCSTCHVIVEDEAMYDKMEEATDDENDMLDLAFGLTETSRLGCQIVMSKELDGLRVRLPSMTRNLQASDFDKKN